METSAFVSAVRLPAAAATNLVLGGVDGIFAPGAVAGEDPGVIDELLPVKPAYAGGLRGDRLEAHERPVDLAFMRGAEPGLPLLAVA